MDENLSQDKYENVNIVDFDPPLVAHIVVVLRIDNNSFKLVASEENSLQCPNM